jgi:hypothetical protein
MFNFFSNFSRFPLTLNRQDSDSFFYCSFSWLIIMREGVSRINCGWIYLTIEFFLSHPPSPFLLLPEFLNPAFS